MSQAQHANDSGKAALKLPPQSQGLLGALLIHLESSTPQGDDTRDLSLTTSDMTGLTNIRLQIDGNVGVRRDTERSCTAMHRLTIPIFVRNNSA